MIVYILSYNLLTPLKVIVEQVQGLRDVTKIILVDNASTYPPLLDWLRNECPVEVMWLKKNMGARCLWNIGLSFPDYYAVCDNDMDISGVPDDMLSVLRTGVDRYPDVIKAGLSWEISDLPPYSVGLGDQRHIDFWKDRRDDQFWNGDVDTSFAVYRPRAGWGGYGPAIRSDRPYTLRHWLWYQDPRNPSDELRYCLSRQLIGVDYSAKFKLAAKIPDVNGG
ncbi:MAG: glycosyltransferase family protein [Planctomycetota bacterium]|jgi:hypothetical protein